MKKEIEQQETKIGSIYGFAVDGRFDNSNFLEDFRELLKKHNLNIIGKAIYGEYVVGSFENPALDFFKIYEKHTPKKEDKNSR